MKGHRSMQRNSTRIGVALVLAALGGAAGLAGCKKSAEKAGETTSAGAVSTGKKVSIHNVGSDTMVNLAQAWAEEYAKVEPSVSIEVSGGGSGVGIAELINGTADLANSSRKMEAEELEKAKAKHGGKEPKEYMVAYDGLAIYVHKDNPLNEISIEQLAEIYKEGGKINKWSELGVKIPGAASDDIVRVSRQNNSGTYHYFRETVVGKRNDYKAGSMDMNGSKDVVELVSKTPGAIGYSGLGYATPAVKIVKVSKKTGEPGVLPRIPTVLDKTYPISRPMFMYTPGEPSAEVKKYLAWIASDAGQAIVKSSGYVPLPK
jgi:phosphate transport system substrate-binding protein